MTLSFHQQAYRTAIAINNVGCFLLNRRCYPQAHQTLVDATQVMLRLARDEVALAQTSLHHDEAWRDLSCRLHAADQRLAFPKKSVTDTQSKHHLSSTRQYQRPSVLRVEAEDFDVDDESDLVLMSAITLHNLALSFLCQALEDPEQCFRKREKLQTKAISLLKTSYRLVQENDVAWSERTLRLALHILESLTQATLVSDFPHESSQHVIFAELEQLRMVVRDLAVDVDSSSSFVVAAAAAA
jgi:hypothetical protein